VHPPNDKVKPRIMPEVMRTEMRLLGLPEAAVKSKRAYNKRGRE